MKGNGLMGLEDNPIACRLYLVECKGLTRPPSSFHVLSCDLTLSVFVYSIIGALSVAGNFNSQEMAP